MFNNTVSLVGNIGKAPEVKTITNGKVAYFSLAVTERWTSKTTGECRENTDWFNLYSFSQKVIAEIEANISRGSFVKVEGKLRSKTYQSNGQTKHSVEIEVFKVTVLARKATGEQQAA